MISLDRNVNWNVPGIRQWNDFWTHKNQINGLQMKNFAPNPYENKLFLRAFKMLPCHT